MINNVVPMISKSDLQLYYVILENDEKLAFFSDGKDVMSDAQKMCKDFNLSNIITVIYGK